MMRSALYLALVALALTAWLTACIDNRLSLGRHDAPPSSDGGGDGDGDGDTPAPEMDASFMPPMLSGGMGGMTGGAPSMPAPDASQPESDAEIEPPPSSPCTDRIAMSATLACEVNNGGGPGGRPESMTTTTTFVFEPDLRAGREGLGHVSGMLAFEAFNATFTGRIEGTVDCARGMLFARIFDGEILPEGAQQPGPFFGDLDGFVDPVSGAIAGPWWHGPDPITPICVGDWAAAPP